MVLADQLNGPPHLVPLRIGSDRATTELVSFGVGILAACNTGPIHWLDPVTGRRLSSPFLPRIEPGTRIDWLLPAPTAHNRFMAAEKTGRIYAVEADGKQMKLLAEDKIEASFTTGLVGIGDVVYAAMLSADGDTIVSIDPKQLTLGTQTPISKGIYWGPKRVGNLVLLTDGDGAVYAFNGFGNLQWTVTEPVGPLAGVPLSMGDKLVFTSSRGMLWVVDANGAVITKEEISEPLGSGPVAFNQRLLVAGWDGTLYLVSVPP